VNLFARRRGRRKGGLQAFDAQEIVERKNSLLLVRPDSQRLYEQEVYHGRLLRKYLYE
jgi:hypothetical protein